MLPSNTLLKDKEKFKVFYCVKLFYSFKYYGSIKVFKTIVIYHFSLTCPLPLPILTVYVCVTVYDVHIWQWQRTTLIALMSLCPWVWRVSSPDKILVFAFHSAEAIGTHRPPDIFCKGPGSEFTSLCLYSK